MRKSAVLAALFLSGCVTLEKPKSGYNMVVSDCGSQSDSYRNAKAALAELGYSILKEAAAGEMFLYQNGGAKGVVRIFKIDSSESNAELLKIFGVEPFSIQSTARKPVDDLKEAYSRKGCKTSRVMHAVFSRS